MSDSTERELGMILAKLEAMEAWQRQADARDADHAQQLAAIQLQLASVKGAGRLLLGVAATCGGMIAWAAQRVFER